MLRTGLVLISGGLWAGVDEKWCGLVSIKAVHAGLGLMSIELWAGFNELWILGLS